MSSRPDPLLLLVKIAAVALAAWVFVAVFRFSATPAPVTDKRQAVLRKIVDAAQGMRFQSPYTKDQLRQRVKDYTGK